MRLKFFQVVCVLLFSIKFNTSAQECSFVANKHNEDKYTCNLGFKSDQNDAFEVHLPGKTDNDVEVLYAFTSLSGKLDFPFCKRFKNLKDFVFWVGKIDSFDENVFNDCKNLKNIHLMQNNITEIPESIFAGNSNLKSMSILSNSLKTLPENGFVNQQNLETLDLGTNEINYLPPNVFKPLRDLQYLNLMKNKLQHLNPAWFQNLRKLKSLVLSNNEIPELQENIFKTLTNLESLALREMNIHHLHPHLFRSLPKLKLLALNTNKISKLPRNIFASLKNLENLQLDHNELTVIHSDSFSVHRKLTKIFIWNNKINAIDERFIDNVAVTDLYIGKNICIKDDIRNRDEMKNKLGECFANYEPRQEQDHCGVSNVGFGNIIGGQYITRGAFPWIVALMKNGEFFCGGTIISDQKIVTAAHCIHEKGGTPKLSREIIALLGGHDLTKPYEVGKVSVAVKSINIHPEWNPNIKSYDADIAILMLEEKIQFNNFIQPICLMDPLSTFASVNNGIVIGYGKSEDPNKKHENIPKILTVPIIPSNEDCFYHNSELITISSPRTFCGGHANGSGVCRGDSGSVVSVTDGKHHYFRGIVSASLFTSTFECDVSTYAVFTNMLKFFDWVNSINPEDIYF